MPHVSVSMMISGLSVISSLSLNTCFPSTLTPLTLESLPSFFSLFSFVFVIFHDGLAWLLFFFTHLRVTSKGESLPNLDCLLTLTMPQIPANEPVRLAPVPAWRKVKSGAAFAPLPIETNS